MRIAQHKTFDMKKFFSYLPILFLGFGLLFSGCIDDKFDEPPIDGVDPDITTNATIADVLELWQPGNIVEITDDLVFSATVISSDEAGNFYKTLVVEDENSGIRFSINRTGLYTDFPQFRRVFVKAKGLYIGDYNELPTIGAGIGTNNQGNPIIERIPSALISQHIIKGKKNRPSPIREKTIAEVTLSDVNRLIRLKDVEFDAGDLNKTMAEQSADANRTLVDCIGNEIPMRNSRYSTFQDALVPNMHGTVDAVVGIFGSTLQLGLSAYEDMKMTETRCTSSGTVTVGDWTYYGVSSIVDSVDENFNALNSGDDVQLAGWLNATDIANGRFWQANEYQTDNYIQATAYNDNTPTTHNWVITPGVTDIGSKILSFRSAWGFGSLEHELKVFVSTDFDGSDIGAATWTEINPVVATSSTGEHQWLNSGDFPLSAFSGVGYVAFEYTGSANNSPSSLRLDDVKINLTGGGGGVSTGNCDTWTIIGTSTTGSSVDEAFDGITNSEDLNLSGWLNATCIDGGRVWRGKTYQSTKYIRASAYNDSNAKVHTLAITPGVTDIGSKTLSFKSAQDYFTQDNLKVLISTDFDGSDIEAATWTEISATLAGSSNSNYEWVDSGNISLSAYSGTGYIAFEYTGSGPEGNTGGFAIDDVKIQ